MAHQCAEAADPGMFSAWLGRDWPGVSLRHDNERSQAPAAARGSPQPRDRRVHHGSVSIVRGTRAIPRGAFPPRRALRGYCVLRHLVGCHRAGPRGSGSRRRARREDLAGDLPDHLRRGPGSARRRPPERPTAPSVPGPRRRGAAGPAPARRVAAKSAPRPGTAGVGHASRCGPTSVGGSAVSIGSDPRLSVPSAILLPCEEGVEPQS